VVKAQAAGTRVPEMTAVAARRFRLGWILIVFVVLLLIPLNAGYYAVFRYRLGHHGVPFGPAAVAVASVLILAPPCSQW
jgi:hypothetical protein